MGFAFSHRKNVQAQVCAIACEQIEKALGELLEPSEDIGATVHALRRRCKKLRGLVRLVRPDLDDADKENAAFRDAAASLSQARDAAVMVETFAALIRFDREERGGQIGKTDADDISEALKQQVPRIDVAENDPFAEFRFIFEAAKHRVEKWSFDSSGFELVGDGLALNYKQFRQRMRLAEDTRAPEHLHDWRKSAKYHGHHISLFRRAAPNIMKGREEVVEALGDLLGDHHNLAVLHEALRKFGFSGPVSDTIAARQSQMADAALALGRQLAAEKPEALRRRFESYWSLLPEKA